MKAKLIEQEAEKRLCEEKSESRIEMSGNGGEKLSPLEEVFLPIDPENEDAMEFSDDPNDMCQLKCNMCGCEVKILGHHVQSCHSVSESTFRMMYPEELFSRKTFHRYRTVRPT